MALIFCRIDAHSWAVDSWDVQKGERFIIFYLDIVHVSALDDGLIIFFNKSVTFSLMSYNGQRNSLKSLQ